MNLHHQFSGPLLNWYDAHGRKELPWQHPKCPYRIWVSEIMLQQTQVQTVMGYFERFMLAFPTVKDLACATEDEVLSLWAGLGYYSRARNLHKSAQIIYEVYQGIIPSNLEELIALPGIGESTAAAITSQAFDQPTPILDANVKRVLARFFQIEGIPDKQSVKNNLKSHAASCMPLERAANYTQAIMDLGALICKPANPNCDICPVKMHCQAFQNETVHLYPFKKIKKPKPTKQEQFLLISDSSLRVCLEKRPSSGIWGGLWSLPSIDMETNPKNYLKNHFGISNGEFHPFNSFKHTFTHFHLILHTLVCNHASFTQLDETKTPYEMFSQQGLQAIGLPKPIKTILTQWFESQPSKSP
jgi:A/G-specific adenine glycosylase